MTQRRGRPGTPLPEPATSRVATKLTDISMMQAAQPERERLQLQSSLWRVSLQREAALARAWAAHPRGAI